ncbi:MAG: T9SS type A sorting domain-containing protein [Bacteroidales bacterium]|nr:T9SS type A sorting domain-containing protein [Bacteroidales bacterium]
MKERSFRWKLYGHGSQIRASGGDLFKLDSTLNVEWQRCYGGSNHDGIIGLLEIEDGYVFSAYGSSNDGDISGWHGESDAWVVKIDFEGNIIWQNCLGGSKSEDASTVLKCSNDDLVIIGSTQSNDGDVSGNHSLFERDNDIWLVKLTSEGELLSQQCFGGAGNEIVHFGAIKKSDNNFVIAGYTDYGPSFDVACAPDMNNPLDYEWWVFEIKDCEFYAAVVPPAPTGPDTLCHTTDSISVYQIVGDSTAWGYNWLLEPAEAGTLTADSLQAMVKWNSSYQGPAHIKAASWNDCGESEWSQAKTSMVYSCVGLQANNNETKVLKVYPNPATDYVIFEIPSKTGTVEALLEIHDIFGRNHATKQITSAKTVLDLRQFKQGIYFYKMEFEGHHYSGKIIVQR